MFLRLETHHFLSQVFVKACNGRFQHISTQNNLNIWFSHFHLFSISICHWTCTASVSGAMARRWCQACGVALVSWLGFTTLAATPALPRRVVVAAAPAALISGGKLPLTVGTLTFFRIFQNSFRLSLFFGRFLVVF